MAGVVFFVAARVFIPKALRLCFILERKLYTGTDTVYRSNSMKTLLPILSIALCSGVCAVVQAADAELPQGLEKREARGRSTYEGGDGSSFEKAVVIAGAKNSMDGVPAESKWLEKKYRNYVKLKQALMEHEGKYFDVITIKTKKGKEVVVYFDISGFFGKN